MFLPRPVFLGFVALACFALSGVGVIWFSGWSRLNCWTEEINIATGHQRHTRYWFWCVTERRIEPTWVSAALGHSTDAAEANPQWRLVLTLSPGTGHSPHYRFHSALHDVRKPQQQLDVMDASPAVRARLAASVVWLWSAFEGDDEAGRFLDAVLTSHTDAISQIERLHEASIPTLESWLSSHYHLYAPTRADDVYAQRLENALGALRDARSR